MYTSSTWHNMCFSPLLQAKIERVVNERFFTSGWLPSLQGRAPCKLPKIRLDGLNGLSWSIENSIWGIEDCGLWITSRSNRVIRKVTLSSPSLWASFHPLFPLSKDILFKSQYEMLKLSIWCTRFESNYSSCAGFFECHLVYNQTQGSDAVFFLLYG
jgi:hypothetical protein